MVIKVGPTGIGPVKDAISNLEHYKSLGFEVAEVLFTYGVYIKKKEDALRIGEAAEKLGIKLSIHAPYFVNLNSKEGEKVENSKKRILKCCEVAFYLGADKVVFHPGFYSGMESAEASANIVAGIKEIMKEIEKNKWNVDVCPEVMGKKNVFGSIDEVAGLVEKTGCGFCVDMAHVLARYSKYEFDMLEKAFPQKDWYCHFSGIEYGDKGEKKHLVTPREEWEKVLKFLKKTGKNARIICESPEAVQDALDGNRIAREV
jgi:deoxyribonuclease-4